VWFREDQNILKNKVKKVKMAYLIIGILLLLQCIHPLDGIILEGHFNKFINPYEKLFIILNLIL
jgi:hypothetical protein